ncbi:unnamed protein product [Adineta ricciae]|uniref:G-protein coupled receptors family 1 profile domain-containing protein n=1 Tax=Adineta ricciae TaxID=249248 RepID=A0A815VJ39_ADIRI|nr:unnamed protein product [Adineta ricciae]CAF1536418.1 unnamed protein product [Adineta ricciae]
MSSTNTSITEAMIIRQNTIVFIRVWSYLMISFGTIGHAGNIYVFTRSTFRSNPCSWYFLAATISGISVVTITTPLRLLSIGYSINAFTSSSTACRILTLIVMWPSSQYGWFIALTCVDRFLCSSSSTKLRAFSSLRTASYVIPFTILIVILTFAHIPVFYYINPKQLCVASPGIYLRFIGIWNLMTYSVGPPIVMLYFGFRTILNIRQSIRRTGANHNSISLRNQQRQKRTDRQLIQMMLGQCTIFILTASLPSIQYIYTSVRANIIIDDLQSAKDSAFTIISGFVSFMVPCLGFYFFTISSKLFRSELVKLFSQKQSNRQLFTTTNILSRNI